MNFFNRLNFTSSNEDGASEVAALGDANHILCLTGSGGRALDLLLTKANKITALDMNKAQNSLLALKIVAIKHLDYHDYLGFIGVTEYDNRLEILDNLLCKLSLQDKCYWYDNRNKVKHGLWYHGQWERILCANAKVLKLLKGKHIKSLFDAPTIEEQTDIWQNKFDGRLLRFFVKLASNRFLWTRILGEPGGAFLPHPDKVAEILASRFLRAAKNFQYRDSDFATLIFKGKQQFKDKQQNAQLALPLHMQERHYAFIKENLQRIEVVTGKLNELESLNLLAIDGYSLSDFGSYCTDEQYRACWQSIIALSNHNARFCERLFMVNHQLPFEFLKVDEALSCALSEIDKAIIYQIRIGKIEKSYEE